MFDQITDFIVQNWVFFLIAILFATLLLNYILRWVFAIVIARAAKTKNAWDDAFIDAVKTPLEWSLWLFGVNFAMRFTANIHAFNWSGKLALFNQTAVIVIITWILLRAIARVESNLTSSEYTANSIDITTAKAVRKLGQASVVIIALLVVLQSFGISITGVLAFGGVGGIAIGFAARDMLANFFGAMMIYFDKPFSVGDWIRSPDQEIEGTVEDIGWRQTVIRTFDKRPLYVPNAVFAKIAVENPSRMSNRRIYETIGLRYDDAGKVADIVAAVKLMLNTHDEIDSSQTLIVNLNQFSASSVDFFIYTFTKTTDWIRFHEIKQDVLLKIEQIIADAGAEMAFPTQTLHLSKDLGNLVENMGSDR